MGFSSMGAAKITPEEMEKAENAGKEYAMLFHQSFPTHNLTTYEHEFAAHLPKYMELVHMLNTHNT